ncbi:cell adhesion molecule 2-like [Anneissia japonica]|uniref:cell adhesion molecule 2-like n=1 Tax=Anneissia japonica TaxID=1529436 RepID=UPI001425A761|nr:cell adhesion molecule 2-like [Anneissia japonica]
MDFRKRLICTIIILWTLRNQVIAIHFMFHPKSKTVLEGKDVELSCLISGSVLDHNLSWLKYDKKITAGRSILDLSGLQDRDVFLDITELVNASTYKFVIRNAEKSDEGEYACAVFQGNEEFISDIGTLTVNQLPDPIFPVCGQITNPIYNGKRVNLECEGEVIDPPINLRLLKSVTGIKEDTKVLKNQWTTPILHSFIANPYDNNAIFTCQLTTPADSSIVRNCSFGPLNVWYKPNITIQHAGTTLSGREAIFICQTNANPPVTEFIWQFDPPLNIDRYEIDDIGQVLRILRVTIDDNGLIVRCAAKNTVGQVTYHVTMEVIDTDNGSKNKPKTNAIESTNDKQSEKKSISLSVLLAVVSVLVLVIVFAIIIPVYYFCICSTNVETVVGQPDVYFEPQDRLTLPLPNKRHSVLWRRSFGAQVPTDRDVDAMYLEIQSDHYIFTPDSRCNTLP